MKDIVLKTDNLSKSFSSGGVMHPNIMCGAQCVI